MLAHCSLSDCPNSSPVQNNTVVDKERYCHMTVLGIAKEHNTVSFTRVQTWNAIMSDSSVLTVSKAVMPTTTIIATIQCNYVNLHRSKFLSHILI